jgi:hypothetical protein
MNRYDLDELIDAAARQMVSGEPSRSFTYDVIARVRGRVEPAPRRFVWVAAFASAVVLCVAAAVVMVNQPAAPVPASRTQRTAVGETPRIDPQIAPQPAAVPTVSQAQSQRRVRRSTASVTRPRVVGVPATPGIELLATESIAVSTLDILPLETEAMAIDGIEIKDITIAPLTASND